MKFQIRKTSEKDITFYQHCFDNSEFHWNLYGNDNLNLQKYVSNEEKHLKFIISQIDNNKVEDVVKIGDEVKVKVIKIDEKGRVDLVRIVPEGKK